MCMYIYIHIYIYIQYASTVYGRLQVLEVVLAEFVVAGLVAGRHVA